MYKPYKGDYGKELRTQFETILEDVKGNNVAYKAFLARGGLTIGFYYDNSDENKKECRAAIGFTFKTDHDADKDYIIKQFRVKGYRYGYFWDTMWLFDYWTKRLSKFTKCFNFAEKFYRKAFRMIEEDLNLNENCKYIQDQNKFGVEMHDNNNIYYHVPIENFEDFDLANIPSPKKKNKKKNQ